MLAHSVWREHPKVIKIRALFGSITPPTLADFATGKIGTYEFLDSYDFTLRDEASQSSKP
jgi:hypothetical protein